MAVHVSAVFIDGHRRAYSGLARISMPVSGSGVFECAMVQMSSEARSSRLMRHAAPIHRHPGNTLYRQCNEEQA